MTTPMTTARQATAQWDTMTTTMTTGDDDNGATGDEVDNDGDDHDYGNGRQQQQW